MKKNPLRGWKRPIPWFSEQKCPWALRACVWQRRTQRELSLSILFLFGPIGVRFDSNLSKFGLHQLRLRGYDGRSVMPPCSLISRQKSTISSPPKMEHLGGFRPSFLVQMFMRYMRSVVQKTIIRKVQRGDRMPHPLVFGTILAVSALSLCLATPYSTRTPVI